MPELWGVPEIAKEAKASRRTVHYWINEDGFPEPVMRAANSRFWDPGEVREWLGRWDTNAGGQRLRADRWTR